MAVKFSSWRKKEEDNKKTKKVKKALNNIKSKKALFSNLKCILKSFTDQHGMWVEKKQQH